MSDGLLGPNDIRGLANALGVTPSKRWGQNFVVDANTVRRIVSVARLDAAEMVLEVGPGLGSLTLGLLQAVERVVAVEIDRALARQLPLTVADRMPERSDRLTVLNADALALQPGDFVGEVTSLVANLPYNVAVPVLLHCLAVFPSLRQGVVMVQREVADRLVADPGSRVYGIPSVKLAWYAASRRAGTVAPSVFWPVPRVESALVAFDVRPAPTTRASRLKVFQVIDAAFAQRRKTLRGALAALAGSPQAAEAVLRQAGIDPRLRGERLDLAGFVAIAEALHHLP